MQIEQPQITLISGGEGISIRILRRPFPNASGAWDRDALDAVVSIKAGPFSGTFGMLTFSNELAVLRDRLQEFCRAFSITSTFRFETLESQLELDGKMTESGSVSICVTVRPDAMTATKLSFVLEPEYMQLEYWINQIDQLFTIYPMTPDDESFIVPAA